MNLRPIRTLFRRRSLWRPGSAGRSAESAGSVAASGQPSPPTEWRTEKELRRARISFLETASGFTPYVVAETDRGLFIHPPDRTVNVIKQLFVWEKCEPVDVLDRAVRSLVAMGHPGWTGARAPRESMLVDVGANVGTTTIPALLSGYFSRAVAIEPEPQNALQLRVNRALNGVDSRIEVVEAAAGSEPGTALLGLYRNPGSHELLTWPGGESRSAPATEQVIDVPVVTIDALVAAGTIDPASTTLLWLDVEGHEAQVLRGASRLVEHGCPIVLEVNLPVLQRHGGLEGLADALVGYSRFHDLRAVGADPDASPAFHPLTDLAALAARLAQHDGPAITDILVVR